MDDKEQSKIAKSALTDMWAHAAKIDDLLVRHRNTIEHAMDHGDDDSQLETCVKISDLAEKLEQISVLAKAIHYTRTP